MEMFKQVLLRLLVLTVASLAVFLSRASAFPSNSRPGNTARKLQKSQHFNDVLSSDAFGPSGQVQRLVESERPTGLRALQQQTDASEATVVTTAQQLLDAVEAHAAHIEIRDHLDLTAVKPRSYDARVNRMLNGADLSAGVKDFGLSIRGNCTQKPSDKDLGLSDVPVIDWKSGQCVLVTDVMLMEVYQNLWLDSLYVRHYTTPRTDTNYVVWCGTENCNLWMTSVTLQGDGIIDPVNGALFVSGGNFYGEGFSIIDFASERTVMTVVGGATVTLNGCTLSRNAITGDSPDSALLSVQWPENVIRMEHCKMSGNFALHNLLVDTSSATHAQIFSDEDFKVHYTNSDTAIDTTLPLILAPLSRPGINATSPWIIEVQRLADTSDVGSNNNNNTAVIVAAVVPSAALIIIAAGAALFFLKRRSSSSTRCNTHNIKPTDAQAAESSGTGASGDRIGAPSSVNTFSTNTPPRTSRASSASTASTSPPDSHNHRRMSSYSQQKRTHFSTTAEDGLSTQQQAVITGLSVTSSSVKSGTSAGMQRSETPAQNPSETTSEANRSSMGTVNQRSHHVSLNGVFASSNTLYPSTSRTKEQDTFDLTYTVADLLPRPASWVAVDQQMDFLHQQLDSFGLDQPIFDDLLLLGSGDNERRQGGQAVVQMAVDRRTRMDYAIKLFVSRAAFEEEHGMYKRGSEPGSNDLSQFLPKVLAVYPNMDEILHDMHGHPLPPCLVMERGTSLDVWAQKGKPDRFQAATVMSQVALRLKDLHAMGYVHRDLKPGNVMWLPRENRWTIIDFGCVARSGEDSRLGFSVAYAAPEVISAYRRGDQSMPVVEAMDAWSLGVVAFELLTGKSALPMIHGKEKVMDCIEGLNGLQLPWEGDSLTAENRRKLGIFRGSITALLARDPAKRPSMEDFCESCNQVLAGSTSVQL